MTLSDWADVVQVAKTATALYARIVTPMLLSLSVPVVAGPATTCPWVLWVEAPMGSDQWSVASAPRTRFTARDDCQRLADDLNVFEGTMHLAEGASGVAHDAYSCQPCTVDPRPEGALVHEGAGLRVPESR
jgi:hypothetical protein